MRREAHGGSLARGYVGPASGTASWPSFHRLTRSLLDFVVHDERGRGLLTGHQRDLDPATHGDFSRPADLGGWERWQDSAALRVCPAEDSQHLDILRVGSGGRQWPVDGVWFFGTSAQTTGGPGGLEPE